MRSWANPSCLERAQSVRQTSEVDPDRAVLNQCNWRAEETLRLCERRHKKQMTRSRRMCRRECCCDNVPPSGGVGMEGLHSE